MKQKRNNLVIIVVIIFMVAMSQEYANMAKQRGFKEALLGFVAFTLLFLGIRYWFRRNRKS